MTSCPHPPTHVPTEGPITQTRDAAEYLERHNITGLLSGMMAGLVMALPDDHVHFMRQTVETAREIGLENVDWQTFVWPLHPHHDPLRRKLLHPPVPVDGGNLPAGAIERRDFILSLTDEETLRRPRLPFWHIDYFTQPQLDDPEFFLVPDWPLPDDLGPPEDVLGPRDSAAVILKPERLCPSPPPEMVDEAEPGSGASPSEPPSSVSVAHSGEKGSHSTAQSGQRSSHSLVQSGEQRSQSVALSGGQSAHSADNQEAGVTSRSTVSPSSPTGVSDVLR